MEAGKKIREKNTRRVRLRGCKNWTESTSPIQGAQQRFIIAPFFEYNRTFVTGLWSSKGRESQILYSYYFSFALRILEIRCTVRDLFRKEKGRGRGKWDSLSLFVSFLNIRESRGVEGCLINDWPDSASDTLRPPPSAPDFVDHLDEIYAARNSEASNTCLRHFAAACSLPCFERGTS